MGRIVTNLSMKDARKAAYARQDRHYARHTVKETTPGLKEWKLKGGAAGAVPDRGFTKQLKAYDKTLEVVWNDIARKWEIWRVPEESGKFPYHVMTVQTEGRTYRELGADILLKLREADPHRFPTLNALCAYFDEMDDQIMRRRRKDLRNKIEAITFDSFDYMRGVIKVQVPRRFKVERVIANAGES
jgi:hypothetical protein